MKHLDDIDELFQNRFADFESEPADDAWDKIQEQISPLPKATQWTPKVYREGILALLLLLLTTWLFVKNTQSSQDSSVKESTHLSTKNETKNTDNQLITKNNLTPIEGKKLINEKLKEEKNQNNINENLENKEEKTLNVPTVAATQKSQDIDETSNNKSQNTINASTKIRQVDKIYKQQYDGFVTRHAQDGLQTRRTNIADEKNIEQKAVAQQGNGFPTRQFSDGLETRPTYLTNKPWQWQKMVLYPSIPTYKPKLSAPVQKPKTTRELYVSIMPIYNYYQIQTNDNDRIQIENVRIGGVNTRLGYRAEVGTLWDLSDRFQLRTGISFAQTNQTIFYQVKTDSIQVKKIDNQGIEISRAVLDKSITEQHQYAGLRIDAQYLLFEGNIDHYASLGLDGQIGLTKQTPNNISLILGYQLAKPISNNLTLWVEPTLSQSLIGQKVDNSLLNINASRIGFHFGVKWKVSY